MEPNRIESNRIEWNRAGSRLVDANAMPPIRSNRSDDEEELLRAGARRGEGRELSP